MSGPFLRPRQLIARCALGGALALGMVSPSETVASPKTGAQAPAASANCSGLLQHTALRLQDEKPQSLCQYSGKVVIVVNTASFCGFTSQYEGLEALHAKYQDRGLVVLGFPSNDFSQETGSNKQIADFCENTFGVKFPMFVKTSVTGPDASALFKALAAKTGWNFGKYLCGLLAVRWFRSPPAADQRRASCFSISPTNSRPAGLVVEP